MLTRPHSSKNWRVPGSPIFEPPAQVRQVALPFHAQELLRGAQGDVYNPFSLLKAFSETRFGSYWFSTGTPTFLTRMIRDSNFDFESLEDDIEVGSRTLENYRLSATDPLPMLYQEGYLTIKSYDKTFRSFFLGLPNDEVRYGLYESLLPLYVGYEEKTSDIEVLKFIREIRDGKGRSDAVVWEKDIIYVFEFKMDGSAKEALEQIDRKDYLVPYQNDGRKLVKVGVNYSSADRQLTEWCIG